MQQVAKRRVPERTMSRRWPGIAAAIIAGLAAATVAGRFDRLSTLVVAMAIGIALGNGPSSLDALRPGLAASSKGPLRLGVVMLGCRLGLDQVLELGWPTMLLVVTTVAATFFGTQALGRRLGLSEGLSLLVATGYSICGASAIAAMESNSGADEEEVALSIGLVTLAGTAAMFGLPLLAGWLDLSDAQFGTWVGASVHDVAQVVGAASSGGEKVLAIAVVVKLTRIILLAPIVAGVSLQRSRRHALVAGGGSAPIMPTFVVGFLATMLLRSAGVLPEALLELARSVEGALFAVALVGLGSGVRVDRFRQLGSRPLLLGLLAWVLVAGVSLSGAMLVAG